MEVPYDFFSTLQVFREPISHEYLPGLKLLFYVPEHFRKGGKDQMCTGMIRKVDKNDSLNPTPTSIWKHIFNHRSEILDNANLSACKARFATTCCVNYS